MTSLYKKAELLANIAIIALALVLSTVLARWYFFPNPPNPPTSVATRESKLKPGTKIPLQGYDWSASERSLLIVLSKDCRFCTESAAFYQRIAKARQEGKSLRLVAVLPQSLQEGRQYIDKLGFKADEVKQAALTSLGATGTPTLILVDSNGVAINSWVGKLPESSEAEVLKMIHL